MTADFNRLDCMCMHSAKCVGKIDRKQKHVARNCKEEPCINDYKCASYKAASTISMKTGSIIK
jgi:hypothetical protein